eukprot:2128801-Alexandrium_andersonii.AAC.1
MSLLGLRSSRPERLKPCCLLGRLSSPIIPAGAVWGSNIFSDELGWLNTPRFDRGVQGPALMH